MRLGAASTFTATLAANAAKNLSVPAAVRDRNIYGITQISVQSGIVHIARAVEADANSKMLCAMAGRPGRRPGDLREDVAIN